MSVVWVGVAAAVVGGAAAYAGSKKQADAATHAANLSQAQYQNNVQMQQPYVQSGYGAVSKLNTLLGINPDPNYRPPVNQPPNMGPSGQQPIMTNAPQNPTYDLSVPRQWSGATRQQPNANPQLRQILQIRADNGDPQAKQMLGMMQ